MAIGEGSGRRRGGGVVKSLCWQEGEGIGNCPREKLRGLGLKKKSKKRGRERGCLSNSKWNPLWRRRKSASILAFQEEDDDEEEEEANFISPLLLPNFRSKADCASHSSLSHYDPAVAASTPPPPPTRSPPPTKTIIRVCFH